MMRDTNNNSVTRTVAASTAFFTLFILRDLFSCFTVFNLLFFLVYSTLNEGTIPRYD